MAPRGELAEYRHVVDQHEMVGAPLVVGGVRYEMLDALKTWRIEADVDAVARTCHRGTERLARSAWPSTYSSTPSPPPWAPTDRGRLGPGVIEAAAAAGTTGKGHLEQAGRWTGSMTIDGVPHAWSGAHGNRDRSLGSAPLGGSADVALVQHQHR